ncbi:MAG: 50S ribosomal protein L25 [Fibrobacteres bacterium]|nr:50S ribosomal protein L25 [Fibrobacterota bacterium]
MSEVVLNAKTRKIGPHSIVTDLRNDNCVPIVLYKRGTETVPLSINLHEYEKATKGHNRNLVVKMVIDGDESRSIKAVVRDIQRDVVKGKIKHMDFLGLDDARAVKIKVPVRFIGEAYGVKTEGGVLEHVLRKVEVSCLPDKVPEFITFDVSEYKNGQAIYVRDMKPVDGIKVLTPGKSVLGCIKGAKSIEDEKPAAAAADAAATPAAGAAAAPAAGAAKAAPDAKAAAGAAKKPEKK